MLPTAHFPRQNQLLAALPAADYERMLPALELVPLPLDWVLYESGSMQSSVYFPTDGIISLVNVTANGHNTEVAMTGNDGLVGVPLLMGGESTRGHAAVRSAGFAYRFRYAELKREFERGGPLQDLLLRYTQALMTQIAQNAVCIRYHHLEQRLCRWLLMSFDRSSTAALTITQEMIANMLGVRREGITEAARNLQAAGLISYTRGHITITDPAKLAAWACECYAVVKSETDRLLPRKQADAKPGRGRPAHTRNSGDSVYASAPTPARHSDMISKV